MTILSLESVALSYGLPPLLESVSFAIERGEAIENADSWGYFCIDLCGYLSKSDRDQILK